MRPEDYARARHLINTNEDDVVNEYFNAIVDLLDGYDYTIDNLIEVAEQQVTIAIQVIETGESYTRTTEQGNVEITPENADEILVSGMLSLVAAHSYKTLTDERYFDSINAANIKVLVEIFLAKVNRGSQERVRQAHAEPEIEIPDDEENEENPQAQSISVVRHTPSEVLFELFAQLKNDKSGLYTILNEKYDFEKFETVEHPDNFMMTRRNEDFYSVYAHAVLASSLNLSESMLNDIDTIAEAMKIYQILFNIANVKKTKGLFQVTEDTAVNMGRDKQAHFNFVALMLGLLMSVYFSQQKLDQFNKLAFSNIEKSKGSEIYNKIIKIFAKQYKGLGTDEQILNSLANFKQLHSDLVEQIEINEINKEIEKGNALLREFSSIVLKGL